MRFPVRWQHTLAAIFVAGGVWSASAQTQNVVLYSSNNAETVETALKIVKDQHPSVHVQQVTGGTGSLMKRMQAESRDPRGDLMWSGGFGTLGAHKDLFAPYKAPDLHAIAAEFRGPSDLWVGTNLHVMVMMINEAQLHGHPAPKTWSDLMQPEWKGKFALTDPSRSATAYMLVYGLLKQFGKEGLEKIAANAIVTTTSSQTYRGVASGEYPVGLTIESIAHELAARSPKNIKVQYATEGSYLAPEGMGLIKGAKNMATARLLYNSLMSKEVQQAQLTQHYRRPTRNDIAISQLTNLPELKHIKVFPLNQDDAASEYTQLLALWNMALAKAR